MRIYILTLIAAMAFSNLLFAADMNTCEQKLEEHLALIDETQTYIKSIQSHTQEITAFEITQLQKKLTTRFNNLKSLLTVYSDKTLNCPQVLGTSVAIYDFSTIGKDLFSNPILRRVVLSFSKYALYELTDFIFYYKKYTSSKLITQIQKEIQKHDIALPTNLETSKPPQNYQPLTLADAAINGATLITAGLVRIWGFISDHTKWRQGRLKDNAAAKTLLLSELKPLDILYEKRTFTLSNYTIRGHWGHVAIWLGTKDELIAI